MQTQSKRHCSESPKSQPVMCPGVADIHVERQREYL